MNKADVLKLLEVCTFKDIFTSEDSYHDVIIPLEEAEKSTIECDSGATKLVLWIPNFDEYVVKIPFTGVYEEDWIKGDKGYLWQGENYREYFGAYDGWDYCYVETSLYADAVREGVDQFFLKTSFLGYIKGHPIYIQPKAVEFYKVPHKISPEEKQESHKICRECRVSLKPEWVLDAIRCYGLSQVKKLFAFINEYQIEDLHGNNLGYYKDKPVIIDYAGFNS